MEKRELLLGMLAESACVESPVAVQSIVDELAAVPTVRVAGTSVNAMNDVVVVRVRLTGRKGGKRFVRTVTAGVDAFSQFLECWDLPVPTVKALRDASPDEAERLNSLVDAAASSLISDPSAVREAKTRATLVREQRTAVERTNLVASMFSLLRSGWTRDMLMSAVHEATCKVVMDS